MKSKYLQEFVSRLLYSQGKYNMVLGAKVGGHIMASETSLKINRNNNPKHNA